jgi:predicted AAA+ superfamily ATPase
MSFDVDDTLVRSLRDHNPWWDDGATALAPRLPARHRSDYYHLARPDSSGSQFEDQPIFGLVGRYGVGKTTLLQQFIYGRLTDGDAPERFCYVPFDADSLYQLQSDEQLEQAIRYYESRVLGRLDDPDPHFLLLDDVHRIEHPNKRSVSGWGTPVSQAGDPDAGRYIVVTASAGLQVERELDRVGVPNDSWDVQPILPEKFRDYLFTLYPPLEETERRVSPTPIRREDGSLPEALERHDPTAFVETLQEQHDRVEDVSRRIQSQVVHYLSMGGILSYSQEGPIEDATELGGYAYQQLYENTRHALYREVPGFESVKTIADLERLCALAARNMGADAVRYQRLVDLFDVDRRTIRDSYLSALRELYLLSATTEYDNARPRSLRLYLRDTGLVAAFTNSDPDKALRDRDREAALARVAAFDHTMRFAYGINAIQGNDNTPTVEYWNSRHGTVDFVFEVDGTPVPIALAYQPPVDGKQAALEAFLNEYETPFGVLLTGDTVRGGDEIKLIDEQIVQIPYWFYLLLC